MNRSNLLTRQYYKTVPLFTWYQSTRK